MDCEMCGKTATMVARVEGAQLNVCDACGRHGTLVKPLPRAPPPVQKRSSVYAKAAPTVEPKQELVEQVRPDIAKLLHQHREKLKLNQEQFAAKLQIRASTYNHYESGAAMPDITTARKLEHVLGTPLVVHIRVAVPVAASKDEQRGLTMGDFIRKKK